MQRINMQPIVIYYRCAVVCVLCVCLSVSVCLFVTITSCAKTVKPIDGFTSPKDPGSGKFWGCLWVHCEI